MTPASATPPPCPLLRRVSIRFRIYALCTLAGLAVAVTTLAHLRTTQRVEAAIAELSLHPAFNLPHHATSTFHHHAPYEVGVSVAFILAMLLLGTLLVRSITAPMTEVLRVAGRLAHGDRGIDSTPDTSPDEAGELLRTLRHLDATLSRSEEHHEHRADDLTVTNDQLEQQAIELAIKTHELEQARVAADAANRAKSQFLSNMSHEIRTPMTAILGYAELLRDESLNPSLRHEHLTTIRRNGEHLLTIINDILDVSKIEAGHMTVERVETRPLDVLRQCLELLRVRAQETEVELLLQPLYPLPDIIESDPVRLRQIVLNLVGNAIKFTPHGQVIVQPAFDPDTQQLHIHVRDTGIGMSPEQLGRLFQPFTQADVSITRRFGGTGLGLTISKRLAEMLGGDITAHSQPHRGSTFTARVATGPVALHRLLTEDRSPAHPRRAAIPSPNHTPSLTLAGRVLLAEDGPDNQRLLTFILTKAGLTVDLAADGHEALDKLADAQQQQRPYHAILMDMQMPRIDGLAATRAARAAGYTGPIIALTAHAMPEHHKHALEAGCTDFITKPIDRAALLERLKHHLHHRAASSQPLPPRVAHG